MSGNSSGGLLGQTFRTRVVQGLEAHGLVNEKYEQRVKELNDRLDEWTQLEFQPMDELEDPEGFNPDEMRLRRSSFTREM